MKQELIDDHYFRVEVLSKTERPNLLSYLALHQCYAEGSAVDDLDKLSKLSEAELGRRVVDKCIKFGHYSVIEAPAISFNVIGFPHNVMVQATRHRHISFSVKSQRYTCERVLKLAQELVECTREKCIDDADYDATVEELSNKIQSVFYFRPLGFYLDRQGNKYEYNELHLQNDISQVWTALEHYYYNVKTAGYAPEHARDFLPQNIRQDFVMSMNARSLLHFCDLRLPYDAQLEIRTLATMMFEHFGQWMPSVAEWYEKNRAGRNKLSP
jgi:thymidylate synthase (FAD)